MSDQGYPNNNPNQQNPNQQYPYQNPPQQPIYYQPVQPPVYYAQPYPYMRQPQVPNPKAAASLTLGIIGVIFTIFGWALFLLPFFGVVFGIISLVLGVSARKISNSGAALAGIVLGIIAIAFGVLFGFACTASYIAYQRLSNTLNDFYNDIPKYTKIY